MKAPLQRRQDWIRGRREKRKQARHARLRRQVLRYAMLLTLIVVGIFSFVSLPWQIRNPDAGIQIHGNKVASEQQIRQVLKNVVGKPLYLISPQALEEKVCSLPVIKYAFVRRYALPYPYLKVEVLEEFPWATFSSTPDGAPEGVIAETGRFIPISQFPTVIQPALHICGPWGMKLAPAQIAAWDGWVRLIAEQTGRPVEMVDLRNPSAVLAHCGKLELHLGAADSTLTRRLGRLASLASVTDRLQDKLKYIDLSLDSNIPLKVDKTTTAHANQDQLLNEAAQGGNHDQQAAAPISAPL